MAKLNAAAKAALREAGFTQAQWATLWGYRDGWGGDQCGCFDDRCANGFHHTGVNDCGCLETMLNDAVAWRAAARYPNQVTLAAPYGRFRYVGVSTPGVIASVSVTAGGFRPDSQAESVVRIEPREGWSAEAATDEHGGLVIQIVKTEEAVTATGDAL